MYPNIIALSVFIRVEVCFACTSQSQLQTGRELHVLTTAPMTASLTTAPSALLWRVSYSSSKYCETHFADVQSNLFILTGGSISQVTPYSVIKSDRLNLSGSHNKRKTLALCKNSYSLLCLHTLQMSSGDCSGPCGWAPHWTSGTGLARECRVRRADSARTRSGSISQNCVCSPLSQSVAPQLWAARAERLWGVQGHWPQQQKNLWHTFSCDIDKSVIEVGSLELKGVIRLLSRRCLCAPRPGHIWALPRSWRANVFCTSNCLMVHFSFKWSLWPNGHHPLRARQIQRHWPTVQKQVSTLRPSTGLCENH